MKRTHIVGAKNSGKTTLIVDLVTHLTSLGYRVGTVKHTHHRHELDTPGKDSHQHREAGAAVVGILSPGMTAVFCPAAADEDVSDRYDRFTGAFADCDIVLVEGHLQVEGFKIEVWRRAATREPLAAENDSIAALVTDDLADFPAADSVSAPVLKVPVFKRSDLPTLADWITKVASGEEDASSACD